MQIRKKKLNFFDLVKALSTKKGLDALPSSPPFLRGLFFIYLNTLCEDGWNGTHKHDRENIEWYLTTVKEHRLNNIEWMVHDSPGFENK